MGDIEGDGVQEVIAVVLCVYPSYGYPTGYQSIVVWDLALNVLGAVTLEDTPPLLIAAEPSGGVTVAYTVCDPEIIVCTPIGTGSGPLARDGDSYVLLPGIAEGI